MLLPTLSTNSSNQTSIIWSPRSHTACKMDTIITYDEVIGFLKHLPTLAPRPDITRLRALRKHMKDALKKSPFPQSAIHGWTSLVMDPTMYPLLESLPFAIPVNSGGVPAILWTLTTATIKILTLEFDHNQNYYNSYNNIYCTWFKMLNNSIPEEIQGVKQPRLNRVELYDVHPGHL